MMDVVGIYRGRPYVARLTSSGVWVVTADGPVFVFPALEGEQSDAVRTEIERLFEALPEVGSDPQRSTAHSAHSRTTTTTASTTDR
jgi:hypothetical protein